MMLEPSSVLCEVELSLVKGYLSPMQVAIFKERPRSPTVATYRFLIDKYHGELSCMSALQRCPRPTALLQPWWPHNTGGTDPYLSPLDEGKLREQNLDAAENIRCVRIRDALNLAFTVHEERCLKASQFLAEKLLLPDLADKIKRGSPSVPWLHDFAARNDLKICAAREFEDARRK
jgi:hypothetical protein